VQRVRRASVSSQGRLLGAIDTGLLVLLGAGHADDESAARKMAAKVAKLRIFADGEGKMNLSVGQAGGAVLAISQFTLYGDASGGNRPSFTAAARPERAEPLVEAFVNGLREQGLRVETGRFGADMQVELVNDGPVTLWLDGEAL
jgi:D-tyrosyl-tRNA(Tyr) deacylase